MVRPHMARALSRCQPENDQRACEQLGPVPTPQESLSSVTYVAVADPEGLCDPGPHLSKHGATDREHQRKEQKHYDSWNPPVFDRRITAPDRPGQCWGGETVEQCKRQDHGQVDVGAVAPE